MDSTEMGEGSDELNEEETLEWRWEPALSDGEVNGSLLSLDL